MDMINAGSCQIANGGCEDICVPLVDGRMCDCDIGLHLQNDSQTCKNGSSFYVMYNFIPTKLFTIESV